MMTEAKSKFPQEFTLTPSQAAAWKLLEQRKSILMWGPSPSGKGHVRNLWQHNRACLTGVVGLPLADFIWVEAVGVSKIDADVKWTIEYQDNLRLEPEHVSKQQVVLETNHVIGPKEQTLLHKYGLVPVKMERM